MRVFHPSVMLALAILIAACTGPSSRQKMSQSQGVKLKKGAQILFGTADYCSRPATVELAKVQAATPEGRSIESTGVSPGSARYRLLRAAMHRRVVTSCAAAARDAGFDLVVRNGDILDARGMTVGDLTAAVLETFREER